MQILVWENILGVCLNVYYVIVIKTPVFTIQKAPPASATLLEVFILLQKAFSLTRHFSVLLGFKITFGHTFHNFKSVGDHSIKKPSGDSMSLHGERFLLIQNSLLICFQN